MYYIYVVTSRKSIMINKAIKLLAEQLEEYITEIKKPGDGIVSPHVELGNISTMDTVTISGKNKILFSLVNISEEKIALPVTPVRGTEIPANESPNLNLYLLFSVWMNNYELSLTYLSWVVEFFNGNNVFEMETKDHEEGVGDYRIFLNMLSLSFEQMNHLWGTLGGRQHPFVCYQARIVS